MFSSAIFHLAELRNDLSNSSNKGRLAQNMADLKNLSGCHGSATRALDTVRFFGHKWEVGSIFGDIHDEGAAQDSVIIMRHLVPVIGELAVIHDVEAQSSTAAAVLMTDRPLVRVDTQLEGSGFHRIR